MVLGGCRGLGDVTAGCRVANLEASLDPAASEFERDAKFLFGGVRLGRPDLDLLVLDASRQEAEANSPEARLGVPGSLTLQ